MRDDCCTGMLELRNPLVSALRLELLKEGVPLGAPMVLAVPLIGDSVQGTCSESPAQIPLRVESSCLAKTGMEVQAEPYHAGTPK